MLRRFEVAHLIGKTQDREKEFRHAENVLTKKGYICWRPVIYDKQEYLTLGQYPNMLDEMCEAKLSMCDLVVIVTPDHIGHSTRLLIRQAHRLGLPIYTLIDDELVDFNVELWEKEHAIECSHISISAYTYNKNSPNSTINY